MWNKPWNIAEGMMIGIGLVLTGLMLQFSMGPVDWKLLAWPANIILLCLFIAFFVIAHALREKVYLFKYLSTVKTAIPALVFVVLLTILMGLTRQVADGYPPSDAFGISKMLSWWPFVLVYLWMTFILALTLLRRFMQPHLSDMPFYLNHLGLLIVILCGTLGSADMQRLKMTIGMGDPEWRALDANGNVIELPIAIQLEEFRIDEYPPRVVIANTNTGVIEKTMPQVKILKTIDKAAPVSDADSTWYVQWPSNGATTAMLVQMGKKRGWLSSGSYLFPTQMLTINDTFSLAMPEREPRAFVSKVHIYTKTGKNIRTTIEVNKPFEVDGWKIYQLDYDRRKGRWSDISVLELVTDPWLPIVYVGIGMMLLGAVCMFLIRRKERRSL